MKKDTQPGDKIHLPGRATIIVDHITKATGIATIIVDTDQITWWIGHNDDDVKITR